VLKLLQGGAAAEKSPALRVALADAAGRLDVQAAAPILIAQLKGDGASAVRVASLRALQALKIKNMDDVMKIAVADGNADVRRAALNILPTLPLSDAAKVEHLSSVIRGGSLADQQAGFDVLGTLKSSDAEKALEAFFDQLTAGKLPAAVQLDLVNAMQANGAASLQSKLETYQKSKGADTLVLAFRDALLAGGNPQRGRDVFVEHPAAACTRCHTVRNAGSDVGPNLGGVASRLSRDQILQSLLDPNAVIAPGFGTVGMTLKNGQRVDGTLRGETDSEVVVVTGTPPAEQRIAKTEIVSRTNPVSAMPPVSTILKPRELRDVISYLMTLR
jgi:quinoprotein glucose dehydrogenase